jgi:iron(III) transport system substrate-binding protein
MWQITLSATPLYNEGLIEPFDWLGLFNWITEKDLDYGGQALIANTQFILPAYNTNLVRGPDVPRTWDDVVDPKWRGKLASTIYQDTWTLLAQPDQWGEERTLEFVRRHAAQDPKLGRFPEVHQRVISGEVALTALDYASWVGAAKEEGAPVEVAVVEPVPVFVSMVMVPKKARHPNAAALLAAWFLTEDGQRLLEEGWVGTSLFKPGTPAARFAEGKKLALPNLEFQLAHTNRLQKQYEDIVVKK